MICTVEHVISWNITYGTLACHGHVMHTRIMMLCTTITSNSYKGGQLSLIPIIIIIISLHSLCNLSYVFSMLLRCRGRLWMGSSISRFRGNGRLLGVFKHKCKIKALGVEDHCAQRHSNDVWYSTLVISLMIVWSVVLYPLHHSPSKLFSIFFLMYIHFILRDSTVKFALFFAFGGGHYAHYSYLP